MVKINSLEIENVKRVKAVRLEPSESGLTIIGGRNGQGKTSILDAIAWALGGSKLAPSSPAREGGMASPRMRVVLSNGIVVERGGKSAALKVTDPSGKKSGQRLLDAFVEKLALDLPAFLNATTAEKGKTLLRVIGIGDELEKLDREEAAIYGRRTEIGRIANQKKKYAAEMQEFPDVPKEPVSASELIRRQQEILKQNAENQRLRENAANIEKELEAARERLAQAQADIAILEGKMEAARKTALDLQDESTEELERDIEGVDELNRKIRANLDKEKAEADAEAFRQQYDGLTADIEKIRRERKSLLDGASLPLPGLSVEGGELSYNGRKWDCMAGSEQLRVATAIVRKLNPNCGFVLMDKLEQMDLGTLREFGAWLEGEGLQAIATRVSTGGECSIIIEDGQAIGEPPAGKAAPEAESPQPGAAPEKAAPAWGSWGK